ncbi:tetratricopeptide repeat protein [Fulvivirgaceae bacterium BMA12]|uniref:Tetratricopeptide repeat protein n=1 Tax=Agaribacillus aureus TaxID=3051825 RepID=A0ABT8L6P7_9BACT|nr:tetratricopeptide repeat protein [Fulvivirgaceae bacterium BMA12]
MRNLLLCLLSFIISLQTFGQSKVIDSLENQLLDKELSDYERKNLLITLGRRYTSKGLPDKAFENLDKALAIPVAKDSLAPLLHLEYAKNYYVTGDFLKALDYMAKLENFTRQESDRILTAAKTGKPQVNELLSVDDVYMVAGEIYRKIGNFEKALENALKGKEMAELLDRQKSVANAYNNIGIISKLQGDLENAKKYYRMALDMNRKLARKFNIGSNYNNMGLIYRSTKQYDSALTCFKQALDYIKSPYGTATIYSNLGAVYYDLKAFDTAKNYHQKALLIQEEHGYKEQASLSRINLAGVNKELGRYDDGISLALNAYKVNEAEQNYDLLSNASEVLANTYEKKGDFENGLFYHRKHKQYHDSVYNENKRQEIVAQQMKFESEEKIKENELLRKQAELNEAKIRFQYIVGGILIVVLLLSIWVFYLTLKRNKIKRELTNQKLVNEKNERNYLEKELVFKNRELVNFSLQIVEKNDFIGEVTREIDKWSKNGLKSTESVKELSKKLKANSIINKHQKEFDAHVNSIYESFYNKLEHKYPGLTQNEKRLAALLRLKLSSKEISSITGISSKSVDMSRYRLRKKLDLETEDNLIEVLTHI